MAVEGSALVPEAGGVVALVADGAAVGAAVGDEGHAAPHVVGREVISPALIAWLTNTGTEFS